MIREKLGGLMYANGKGELITKTEYLRWKYRNNQKVFGLNLYVTTVKFIIYLSMLTLSM